jgi:hypothetical protein
MAAFTVTTAVDLVANDGELSLREAVARANATAGADTIRFAAGLEGQTLALAGGELTLSRDVRIDGDRDEDGRVVTLSGGDASRLLTITGGNTDVGLSGLALAEGRETGNGGAILLDGGGLILDGCTVRDCAAYRGGGIYAADGGRVLLARSSVVGNQSTGGGGGFAGGPDVALTVRDSLLEDNGGPFSGNPGGAIRLREGSSLVVEGSDIRDNIGDLGGGLSLAADTTSTITRSTISGNYAFAGGGIQAAEGSRVTIVGGAVVGNRASIGDGGGIELGDDAELTVRGGVLADNVAGNPFFSRGGAIALGQGSSLVVEGATIGGNSSAYGGGLSLARGATGTVARSTIAGNDAYTGGGIAVSYGRLTLRESTVADNFVRSDVFGSRGFGGGLYAFETELVIRNSAITGNRAGYATSEQGLGGGIYSTGTYAYSRRLDLANSIVAGNAAAGALSQGPDVSGNITLSNGRNVFGSDVAGSIAGDRENVAPGALFAALDPDTGGGLLGPDGVVVLRANAANPALSAADPLAAMRADQLGSTRPQPRVSLPDLGAAERDQTLSTTPSANNDVLVGTSGRDTIAALAGNDLFGGLAGNDALRGGDGGDVLDGGPGDDRLDGGPGIDLVSYLGDAAVAVDLSGAADAARRGGETDALIGVEGAVGSSAADSFVGDGGRNFFHGAAGKDTYRLGGGRDVVDIDRSADSGPGTAARDVVADFTRGSDLLDLTGIDADTTVAGDQAFRFAGTAALSGAGQVGYFTSGGNTIVRGSTDADAAAELQVQLNGLVPLSVDDFYL